MDEKPARRGGRRRTSASGLVVRIVAVAALLVAACGAPSAGPPAASTSGGQPAPGGDAAQQARPPSTVAEIALYQGADREQILIAGAQQEGKLVYYNSLTWMEQLSREFEKKYPFVQVEVYRSDSPDLVERLTNEYKAGRYTTDVLHTTHAGLELMREANHLQEFWSPELAQYPPDVTTRGSQSVLYVGSRENHVGVGFNTTQVSAAEAPRTYDDLLDPKWKGRMSLTANSTGAQWLGVVLETRGRDYVQRLGTQDLRMHNMAGAALAQLVVSGEVPLSPVIFDNNMTVGKEKGAPVEWRPLEPVMTNVGFTGLLARAPHPHAAMLFTDYLQSREGQEVMLKGGLNTPRLDMLQADKSYQKWYWNARYSFDEYEKQYADWERLLKQLGGR
jgi:iron(III) transport system substrate-binding protein